MVISCNLKIEHDWTILIPLEYGEICRTPPPETNWCQLTVQPVQLKGRWNPRISTTRCGSCKVAQNKLRGNMWKPSSWWRGVTPWAACKKNEFFWQIHCWISDNLDTERIKIWSCLRAEWSGALRDGSQSHSTPDHLATFSMMPSVLKSRVIFAC